MATISDSPVKSSSPSFSALSPVPTSSGATKKSSMEEVWSDISLSSLDHPSKTSTGVSASNFGLTLQDSSVQDFLSRSPPKGKQRTCACRHSSTGQGGQHSRPVKESDNGFFAYTSRVASILGSDTRNIHCVERSHGPSSVEPQLHTTTYESHDAFGKAADSFSFSRPDPSNYCSPVEFSIVCKKRIHESDDSTSDHRTKRLMKNRESAARSRARKQAYTNELELKVFRLVEENGRLRRQLEKHCTEVTPAQYPKKHTLQRTLTAPF